MGGSAGRIVLVSSGVSSAWVILVPKVANKSLNVVEDAVAVARGLAC